MSGAKAGARVLGLDYGRARIGMAVADSQTSMARPLATLVRKNRNEDMRALRDVVRDHAIHRIVIGLPLRLDGSKGEMAAEVERFGERLRKQTGLPVEFVDERLTSWEAESILRSKGTRRRGTQQERFRGSRRGARQPRKEQAAGRVDALAAAVILREYLAQSAPEGAGG